MSGDFTEEIEAVQAYYVEGRPLAERLAWECERLEKARTDFNDAQQAFMQWDDTYRGSLDHPIQRLVEALQRSVDYVPPSSDHWIRGG